jgi:hypothetical protein
MTGLLAELDINFWAFSVRDTARVASNCVVSMSLAFYSLSFNRASHTAAVLYTFPPSVLWVVQCDVTR